MFTSFHRRIALSVLVAFLAGLGSWELQARAFAHQVEHAMELAHPVQAPDHDHDHDHGASRDTPSQEIDHAVLHAVGVAPAVAVAGASQADLERAGIIQAAFVPARAWPAIADPPLRPPRAPLPLG